MSNEVWKDIDGFDGLYQVSNYANIRSMNGKWSKEPVELSKSTRTDGYQIVTLHKNKKQYTLYVHRVVAEAFVENDDPVVKTDINHIDEDKSNNLPSNLMWCSAKENNNWGTHNQRVSDTKTNSIKTSKQVICRDTNEIFPSASEVERKYGYAQGNISRSCRKGIKAYGYNWDYI